MAKSAYNNSLVENFNNLLVFSFMAFFYLLSNFAFAVGSEQV